MYVPEKNQDNRTTSEKDVTSSTEGGVLEKSDDSAKPNQELSSKISDDITQGENVQKDSESSEADAVKKNETGEVKGDKDADLAPPKSDDDVVEPDSTTETTGDIFKCQDDPEVEGQENEPVKTESLPLTSSDDSSSQVTKDKTEDIDDGDLQIASSTPEPPKDDDMGVVSGDGTNTGDPPQESMEIQEADDSSSKSATDVENSDQQTDDQPKELTTTTTPPSSNDESPEGQTEGDELTLKKREDGVQNEDDKSEDEGVESDLDLDEDEETQPLVSPTVDHDTVLSEEQLNQRQLAGYSTLDNDDESAVPGSASDEKLNSQADVGEETGEGIAEVAQTSSSVAMDTETSPDDKKTDVPPVPTNEIDNESVEKPDAGAETTEAAQDKAADDDVAPEHKKDFVDFSSGLFADNLSGASLVPDITECMQEVCEEELSAIKAKGVEIRRKSADELEEGGSTLGDISEASATGVTAEKPVESAAEEKTEETKTQTKTETDGSVTKVSSATDATASKEMNYNKTNLDGEYTLKYCILSTQQNYYLSYCEVPM